MTERASTVTPEKASAVDRLMLDMWLSLIAISAIAFSHIVTGIAGFELWRGLGVVYVVVVFGYVFARLVPIKSLPDLFWISVVAMVVTWPGVPGSVSTRDAIDGLSFLPTITPLMAFAALGLGTKEVELFRRAGLHFAFISLLVFCGTFLGSALIAHIVLGLMGG